MWNVWAILVATESIAEVDDVIAIPVLFNFTQPCQVKFYLLRSA